MRGRALLVVAGGRRDRIDPLGIGLALVLRQRLRDLHRRAKRLLARPRARAGDGLRLRRRPRSCSSPVLVLGRRRGARHPRRLALALYLGVDPDRAGLRALRPRAQRLSAGETATLTLAEPLTAAALGVLVLGERPGALAAAGAALMLAGLLALALPERRGAATASPRPATHGAAVLAELERVSTVDALADALRPRILDGELAAGRAAARARADRALRRRPPQRCAPRCARWRPRGWSSSSPTAARASRRSTRGDAAELFELRTALELEAAHLALERGGGRLPQPVHERGAHDAPRVCAQPDPPWSAVVDAHDRVHRALVAAAESPRIGAPTPRWPASCACSSSQLRPSWTLERMAEHHDACSPSSRPRGRERYGSISPRRRLPCWKYRP